MEPGPSTTRPHTDPSELAKQFERSGTSTAILTTPEDGWIAATDALYPGSPLLREGWPSAGLGLASAMA